MVKAKLQAMERRCPACESSAVTERSQKNGFRILSCRACRTLYAASLPTLAGGQNYDDYYDSNNLSLPDFITQRLDEIFAGFSRYRLNNRLLEVGFGAGSILEAAVRAGWATEGIEISQSAVDHARALGFSVFKGELSEANYPANHFDVVVASEILEHVPDPLSLVREIARVLRPGGLFWATTPNSKSASFRLLGIKWSAVNPPDHLHLFSRNGMENLLRAAGFKTARIHAEGLNPFEVVHELRPRKSKPPTNGQPEGFDRVQTGYALNAALVKSPLRRSMKVLANSVLKVTGLGDSLKIWAER